MKQENRDITIRSVLYPKFVFKVWKFFYEKNKKIRNFFNEEKNIRKKWYSLYLTKWKTFSLTWKEADYDESKAHINISILWLHLYIYTSQKNALYDKATYDYNKGEREYGIKIHNDGFWIYKGLKQKKFEFPYTYRFIRHSILKKDGSWEHEYSKIGSKIYNKERENKNFWDESKWKDILYTETFDYTYTLKSGKKQHRKATIKVEEREWRRKILLWTKYNRLIRKVIDINFDKEVGEKSGSWKGGVVGINYELLPNETPLQCLRRFEKNVKL